MEYFNFDRLIGFLGFILGIIGIILTIKSNKRVVPFYGLTNLSVLTKRQRRFEEFRIVYKDIILDQASVSNFIFWNGGNQTLNFVDSSDKLPFRLWFSPTCKILDAFLIHESNLYNATSISHLPENNFVDIKFDYLEPQDGFIVKIVHTETDFSKVYLQGAFKGSKPIEKTKFLNDSVTLDSLISTSVAFITPAIYLSVKMLQTSNIYLKVGLSLAVLGLIYLLIRLVTSFTNYKLKKVPTKLEKIFQEN